MNLAVSAQLRQMLAVEGLSQARRALRMRLGRANAAGADLLLQRIDIHEALNDGIAARLTCLSPRADLPLKSFIGQPIEVQVVTDRGALRRICAIVTGSKVGQSDGSLTVYELEAHDALSILERRINSRVFMHRSDVAIVEIILSEWRQRSPALAAAFDFTFRVAGNDKYPEREFIHQFNESDAAFVRRLLKRSGISWFFRPGGDTGDTPVHEMVLFDEAMNLEAYAGGAVRFHRDDATEQRDAITRIVHARDLVSGTVERKTWDYKANRIDQAVNEGGLDQGEIGGSLATFLADSQIEMPHAGDSWADHERRTGLRMDRHEMTAKYLHGESGVRDLSVGEYIRITGHPKIDAAPASEQEFVVLDVHHWAENNLPKELNVKTHLLTGSDTHTLEEDKRYRNHFKAVRRDTSIVPTWEPLHDLPKVHPVTAIVVGPQDEEVHTDELGRVKVRLQGYKSEDHQHAQGAGVSGSERDSAWVRYVTALAGNRFGADFIPRVGMEVYLDFLGGDPDRPIIVGVIHNGHNTPAAWSDTGALPGNRYVSGIKTKEIRGSGFNQLRYDDTPGQISIQWGSSYAATQLNGGWLTQPRTDGQGAPRGEGLEARSDAQVAVRGGKGVYITSQPQGRAGGNMLERQALLGLADQLQGIVKNLGETSSTHKAEDTDSARIEKIVAQLKDWDGGSNVNESAANGGAPMVAIDAPAGIAVTSQDSLVLGAQNHIDMVSAGNTQVSAGRRLLMRTADIFSAFAGKGMKLITAEGKLQIEAHKDNIEVTGPRQIVISAGEEIVLQAPKIRFVAQGTQVDHGGGRIVEQSQTLHHIMSPDFSIGGAGGGSPSVNVPSSKASFNQQVVMRWHGSEEPMKNQKYRITAEDGKVVEGRTDAQGKTERFDSSVAYGRYTIEPLDD
ncbi:type VI secretion system tip protein VgrG [Variovorax sp. ZS18.2.2]|uniref:type VI secretion system Vgr family protein n=1 Tax=Variovorax sp. ZS18.2.2 TaxID=2971255 RepID=UPI0021506E92|nr:type VI secretion system Vgr family protein [Variovorax sp. ZS18.2.2]MCR6479986.1 type VI secretion system tip protein VgrG [Variovorax sp. ZS18.2.2]